ncbi:MAG: sialidase family protein, partial [Armatimonadota bacterium]
MDCYTDEWRRTAPDLVVYLPSGPEESDSENQHFLVVATPRRTFLAFWTQATRENAPDQRCVVSRSEDRGHSWSQPVEIGGPGEDGRIASWGFPIVVPHSGRVYYFYNKNVGVEDVREDTTGECWYRWSDDDGRTWSGEHGIVQIRPGAISHPDPGVPPSWICYQTPILTPGGDVLAGFTRWASRAVGGDVGLFELDSEIWFLRFEDILTADEPLALRVTIWPEGDRGLRVPRPDDPTASVAQEPSVQPLPDGRLICAMRTLTGSIWFALSDDDGRSWDDPRPLRYCPGGPEVLQPIAPCPLYRLRDGRYLLLFHNNDGTAHGGQGPGDYRL